MTNQATMVTPQSAALERIRREKAKRHLVDFSEYVSSPWYEAYPHHDLVGKYLEEVALFIETKGKEGIGRLMIFMPPRHGKTEQVSRQFPAWLLGRMPDKRIILTSYNADRANASSRAARDLVLDQRYSAVFGSKSSEATPVRMSDDSRSVTAWDLAAPFRGGVVAAGVGGGITGTGAHLMVVDDPLRNREEAESEARRNAIWEWWTSTAYTRLEDGAAVVIILTRWHPDDLAGRLLKAMASDPEADQYTVLNLPAIWEKPEPPDEKDFETYHQDMLLNGVWTDEDDQLGREEGEALWPEKYNEKEMARIQVNVGAHDWSSLYQQSPIQRDGQMFKPEWLDVVDTIPGTVVERVRYWDKAGSEGKNDYTCGVLLAKNDAGHFFIEHVVRERLSFFTRNQKIRRTNDADLQRPGPLVKGFHEVENGAAGIEAAANTVKEMQGRPLQMDPVGNKSKEVRATAFAVACEALLVHLVRAPWNQAYIEELMMFPKGKHDDQVDASSGAYNKIARSGRSGVH